MKRFAGNRILIVIIAVILCLGVTFGILGLKAFGPVHFNDPVIEALIRQKIFRPEGEIFPSDLDMITEIDARGKGISDLGGLQYLKALRNLYLQNNEIDNIRPISGLARLNRLGLAGNRITDFAPLIWMIPRLEFHDFSEGEIQAKAAIPNTGLGLVINEVMTACYRNYYDKLDATSDWIEIWNAGQKAVSLDGYGLSDDSKDPFKFTFPSIVLPPNRFLLVRASGTEYKASQELHAKFKLKQTGETLVLSSKNGRALDWLSVPELEQNQSYGRIYSAPLQFAVMAEPSPGKTNTGALVYLAKTGAVSSNFPSGYYPESFLLELSCTDLGATIHYTLDGSLPDLSSPVYSGPLDASRKIIPCDSLTSVPAITELYAPPAQLQDRALVIRARAFKDDYIPSDCFSAVYFFHDISRTHTMPVLNVTASPHDLMDSENGIYVLGNVYDEWKKNNPGKPYQGDSAANYNRRGDAWRIPVQASFFDGQRGFSIDAEMKLMGGWSRATAQKSFQLVFHDQDDRTSGLNYELFPGLSSKDGQGRKVDFFRSAIFRNGGNDWPLTQFRDPMIQGLLSDFPLDTQAFRPVAVYLNGEYWGILNMMESYDEGYFYSHYRVPMDKVAVLEGLTLVGDGTPRIGTQEDLALYRTTLTEIESADFTADSAYQKFDKLIDLKNHALYAAAQCWIANLDWPGNNIRYWRYTGIPGTESSSAGAIGGLDGRYRWLLYDTEFSFNIYNPNTYNQNMFLTITSSSGPEWPNPPWSTLLFRQFMKNPEYSRRFVNACCDLMNSAFNESAIEQAIARMKSLYAPEMAQHQARWPLAAGGTLEQWNKNIESILYFAKKRNPVFQGQMKSFFNLKEAAPVVVRVSSGGKVLLNNLTLSPGSFGGQYYGGNPVDLTAVPEKGYVFTGWSGSVLSSQQTLSLDPGSGVSIQASFAPM
jgi:hypothetical protein